MRLAAINCVILACTAVVLADEPRPRRHLHKIKEMIVNKLFSSSEPNCTHGDPPLETKFFKIPGFNDVVIKAVPKGSNPEPTPVYENLPPNSHIEIVGSYLGTRTLNETYNALLGVKNLLTSGILSGKPEVLQKVGLVPSKVQVIAKPVKPCAATAYSPLPLKPVDVLVKPPRVPVVPTQYSYKQVNQDGSLTTYTSSLSLENGVKVIDDGKTVPFFIDRVRKIPVSLPIPVLPELSKIIVPEAVHPATYSDQQIHGDGRMTSYMGLPGPVVVTETGARIPPPPVFLMDRIENVAAIASYPRAPFMAVPSKLLEMNAAVSGGGFAPVPATTGYSYAQMNNNGGMTTHSATGVKKASVLVTENGVPTVPQNAPSLPEKNPFKVPADGYGTYSYIQVHGDGQTSFGGLGVSGPVNVVERKPISVSPDTPFPPNSFSYKQIGDGKMTTYTGSDTFEESYGASPAVILRGMGHPVPPPHITDRIERVAAGAKYNRPPYFTIPAAVPVPTGFVKVPSVHSSHPQRPVKIPTTPGINSFVYKHVHNDGSVTNYGSDGLNAEEGTKLPPAADTAMPIPQSKVNVFESPMYSGPFPMNSVNPNAIKPSTPVSGSYSYKLMNSNFQGSHPPVGPIDGPFVDTFAPPPPTSMPSPIRGCIDPEISNTVVHIDSPATPVPLTYSYKQISQNNLDPFLVVNVEDPVMGITNPNVGFSQNKQGYPSMPPLTPPLNQFPTINNVEHKPTGFMQPKTFESAPVIKMPVPQGPIETSLPSSFSYKSVTNQAHQLQAPPLQPAVSTVEHNPPKDSSPASSFSYKHVTSQAYQPLPSAQPTINDMEHRPRGPSIPPTMTNMRMPEIEKDNAPFSFSYKQATSQGVYEYSDEFPTGVKTNLSPTTMSPLRNPPGHIYVEQKPLSNPAIPTPIPESPLSTPSRSTPTFNGQDSLANNPIIVPGSSPDSSFSFKSANADGSTITVKNDGHNSIAVQVQEAPKTEAGSQDPTMLPSVTEDPHRMVTVLKESVATSAPEEMTGPVSEYARPMSRRVIKRVKLVNRGDIPDDE